MSYILDALQRADAERARADVPGLHARQIVESVAPKSDALRIGMWWAVAAVAVLGAIAAGFWLTRAPAVTVLATTPQPQAQPMPAVATPQAQPQPAPVPALAVSVATTPAAQPVKPRTVLSTSMPAVASKPAVAALPTPPASAAPTATPVPWFADLPEDVRRQIPKLAITGAVYSDNPAQRLLLVNGLVLTQGSEVAPELSLVEIHSANSEFVFRNTHFRLAH